MKIAGSGIHLPNRLELLLFSLDLTRWAAAGLIIILAEAIYVSKFVYGIGFVTRTSAGWNFPLTVLAGCLIFAAFGAGNWSIDNKRRK
jgi:uncharacterized membrane protein YphA (DoxX/SURF4 family)